MTSRFAPRYRVFRGKNRGERIRHTDSTSLSNWTRLHPSGIHFLIVSVGSPTLFFAFVKFRRSPWIYTANKKFQRVNGTAANESTRTKGISVWKYSSSS